MFGEAPALGAGAPSLGEGEQETVLPEVTQGSVWLSQDSNLGEASLGRGPCVGRRRGGTWEGPVGTEKGQWCENLPHILSLAGTYRASLMAPVVCPELKG